MKEKNDYFHIIGLAKWNFFIDLLLLKQQAYVLFRIKSCEQSALPSLIPSINKHLRTHIMAQLATNILTAILLEMSIIPAQVTRPVLPGCLCTTSRPAFFRRLFHWSRLALSKELYRALLVTISVHTLCMYSMSIMYMFWSVHELQTICYSFICQKKQFQGINGGGIPVHTSPPLFCYHC